MATDEWSGYFSLGDQFSSHENVSHKADQYVRGDVHTNTVEGNFSIFKRGTKGRLSTLPRKDHRYVAEFDFRYNNRTALRISDMERADNLAIGIVRKRLTYRRPVEAERA